jgi:hypothetical protein
VDPEDFYTRRVPAQWNRTLHGQEPGRVREAMEGVDATIRVLVRGDREESFHLNVAKGHMSAGDPPAKPPFMTLAHDLAALAILEKESGDSVLGFLGGLAGLEESMKLTTGRMQNLSGMHGTLRFALTGEGGFELFVHFGEGAVQDAPRCSLSIARDAYEKLRRGAMNPQEAFMNQQIAVEGDMQMAMQLALAAMSPD